MSFRFFFLFRICNTVSRTCFSDSNGTLLLLKTMLLLLIALAIVAVVLNQCYTATGKFYCRPDVSLAVNPRLRYVLGPPPT